MEDSVVRMRIMLLLLVCVVGVGIFVLEYMTPTKVIEAQNLRVSFLDVGQGDAILITTQNGIQVLIDGGRNSAVLSELSREMSFFDRQIDVVIATHPDLDHVGGLVDVLERYQAAMIVMTQVEGESPAALQFKTRAETEQAMLVHAQAGQVITLDASTTLTILSPTGDASSLDPNTGSIVAVLQYGDIGFMLTGDAPVGIENYLVSIHGELLEAEVLKLGHHGSKTSTADAWLAAVDPLYAVVSAGKDNRYQHPHPSVIARVRDKDIPVLSTITSGTVTFVSDGREVWVK